MKLSPSENWQQQADEAKAQAAKLPHGKEREALLKEARQLETAAQSKAWANSRELQPPK